MVIPHLSYCAEETGLSIICYYYITNCPPVDTITMATDILTQKHEGVYLIWQIFGKDKRRWITECFGR